MQKNAILALALFASISCQQNQTTALQANASSATNEIIGGRPVGNLKLSSGIVFIAHNRKSGSDHGCTASYLGNNRVLTAAHCTIKKDVDSVQFLRGQKSFWCDVVDIKTHPAYEEDNLKFWYDVSVLKIDCKHQEEKLSQIIPFKQTSNDKLLTNEYVIAGYGYRKLGQTGFPYDQPKDLSFISTKKSQMSRFIKMMENSPGFPLAKNLPEMRQLNSTGDLLCTDANDKMSTYNGDSGGPLFNYNTNREHVILGVTSIYVYTKTGIVFNCAASYRFNKAWIDAQFQN